MLKLERRDVKQFLDAQHQKALKKRVAAATKLAAKPPSEARKTSIQNAWKNFRAGKTSAGTCDELWNELWSMSFTKCALCDVPGPGTIEHLDEKSKTPARMFDWNNLLPACGECNRRRENSGIDATPIDPSNGDEPLEILGWSEYGQFTPLAQTAKVKATVEMYGLDRFDDARKDQLVSFKAHLFELTCHDVPPPEIVAAIQSALKATSPWRGPIREYLLRPPTPDDEWLVDEAIRRLPEIRLWVRPWLRPGRLGGARWP